MKYQYSIPPSLAEFGRRRVFAGDRAPIWSRGHVVLPDAYYLMTPNVDQAPLDVASRDRACYGIVRAASWTPGALPGVTPITIKAVTSSLSTLRPNRFTGHTTEHVFCRQRAFGLPQGFADYERL